MSDIFPNRSSFGGRSHGGMFKLVGGLIGAFAVAAVAIPQLTQDEVTFTVREKDRLTQVSSDGDGNVSSSTVRIVVTDDETFSNTVNWLAGKFNADRIDRQLKVGQTYDCKVYGFNWPALEVYRNLVECRPR